MSGPAIVGWCPGALRPMASGDGLVVRVKPRGGRLTLAQAAAIAQLSQDYGNGHLDLTSRANLQIRGARPETLDALTAGLRAAGLLDANAATEALRNIVASPLVGVDPDCFDIQPALAQLEAGLGGGVTSEAASLIDLPAKWSFVIDGGGVLPLAGVPADIRVRFDQAGAMRVGLDTLWAKPLARPLGLPELLTDVAALVAGPPKPMRMKGLVAALGAEAVFAALGLRVATEPIPEPTPVGAAMLFAASNPFVGFAPAFGNLPATTLAAIVAACRAHGGSDIRLTPWRAMIATGIAGRTAFVEQLDRLGLILRADDPRLAISTCVGAPACHRGTTPARSDAAVLAARIGQGVRGTVHVSGCAKECARPPSASWALIGREGAYDVFSAGDAVPRITGLSSTAVANWLSRAERVRIS